MTTLYRALHIGFQSGRGPVKDAVLDVSSVLANGELQESDIEFVSRAKIVNNVKMAANGKIAVRSLLDDGERMAWVTAFAAAQKDEAEGDIKDIVNRLNVIAPGFMALSNYRFPALSIAEDAPLDVVVDIFEGMNRRGQHLNKFDLMVARLYSKLPDGTYYDLRDEWEQRLANADYLTRLGVGSDDGMLPLQLIAMQVSRLPDGARPPRVTGLNNKDVLELPANQVIGHKSDPGTIAHVSLASAVDALNSAAKLLVDHCGVTCGLLLPQQSMLLPIADQFLQYELNPNKRLSPAQMKQWFFAAGLSINYYGSVNSYAARHCRELTRWAESNGQEKPEVIAGFTRAAAGALNLQQPFSREGNILGTALMALMVSKGANDWRVGQIQISALQENIEFHHMVPEKTLRNLKVKKEDRRPIAALTAISASRNASIRDQSPAEVMAELKKDANPILDSHLVDRSLLENGPTSQDAFESFVRDREERLRKFVIAALGL